MYEHKRIHGHLHNELNDNGRQNNKIVEQNTNPHNSVEIHVMHAKCAMKMFAFYQEFQRYGIFLIICQRLKYRLSIASYKIYM